MPIPRREANAILTSLRAGVAPSLGLRHIVVGRKREIEALIEDFKTIRDGGATLRFVIGRYGSGKSFLLQIARLQAMERRFEIVVAHADLTPARRLHGSDNQALALYRELMRNLSTQARPDGNALPAIVEKWLSNIQAEVVSANPSLDTLSSQFTQAVNAKVSDTLSAMQEVVNGFDFAQVINAYYRGHLKEDEELKSNALRWLRGEFNAKTEANKALGVRSIVDDENWYDCLKAFARFARQTGYGGLLVCIDEAVNLYKITNTVSRNNNYERLLGIVNDCLQGRAEHIGFLFGGTPEFLENQQRGLFSYEALRSRLASSRFEQESGYNLAGPVLRLPQLSNEEIFVLLLKLRDLHANQIQNSRPLDDQAIETFMKEEQRRVGAEQHLTPRELVRDFIAVSDLLTQQPEKQWQELLGQLEPLQTDDLNEWPTELSSAENSPPTSTERFVNMEM